MPTACCCPSTACVWSICSNSPRTSNSRWPRPRIRRSRARPPEWNGWPVPPPICSTSSTRACRITTPRSGSAPTQSFARRPWNRSSRSSTRAVTRSVVTCRTAPSSKTPNRHSTSPTAAGGCINYPERLSYSATPPDFGSLAIQRRRWANGGLLILPKLWRNTRAAVDQAGEHGSTAQTCLRVNYMASTAWSSIGLSMLLAYPFDSKLLSPLILVAALPYFLAMASDLHHCGYKRTDIFRIYGFNLILLPVNLAGVFKSMQQADHRQEDPVRADAEGQGPHGHALAVRGVAVLDHRVLGVDAAGVTSTSTTGAMPRSPASTAWPRRTRWSRSWACATRWSTSGWAASRSCT